MTSTYSRLVGIGYFTAAVLVLFPAIDLAANVWPFEPWRVNWRYGGYVLLSGFALTMILGMAMALLIARAGHHGGTQRTLSVLNGLLGALIVAGTAIFILDTLQLRASVAGEARSQFAIGALKAVVKNLIASVGFLWIAWIGWRRRSGSGGA